MTAQDARVRRRRRRDGYGSDRGLRPVARYTHRLPYVDDEREAASSLWQCGMTRIAHDGPGCLCTAPTEAGQENDCYQGIGTANQHKKKPRTFCTGPSGHSIPYSLYSFSLAFLSLRASEKSCKRPSAFIRLNKAATRSSPSFKPSLYSSNNHCSNSKLMVNTSGASI